MPVLIKALAILVSMPLFWCSVAHSDSKRLKKPADMNILVRSATGSKVTPYNQLTREQRKQVNQVISLLKRTAGNRPPPSRRIRNSSLYASAQSTRSSSQIPLPDCELIADYGVLCWFGDNLCGFTWGGPELELGCFD